VIQKRETGSIESEEISGGGSRDLRIRTVIPEFSGFSLNSRVLTYLYKCHFLCKVRRIHVYGAHRNSCMLLFRASEHFTVELGHFNDSSGNGVLRGCLGSSLGGSF